MKRLCDHKIMGRVARNLWLVMILMGGGAAILGGGASAWAQTGAGKASGGNSNLEAYLSAGFLGLSSSSTQIDLSPGFNFKPLRNWNWLQLGGELTYQKITFQGGSATNFVLSGGPTFNLGPTTGDASFISLGLLVKTGSASYEDPSAVDPNGFGFYLMAGKRFPLSTNLSMRPSIGVESAGSTALVIRPLAMSLLF
jgi:hypothetical protein